MERRPKVGPVVLETSCIFIYTFCLYTYTARTMYLRVYVRFRVGQNISDKTLYFFLDR